MSWAEVVVVITAAIWTATLVHMRYGNRVALARAAVPVFAHQAGQDYRRCACGYEPSGDYPDERSRDWGAHLMGIAATSLEA